MYFFATIEDTSKCNTSKHSNNIQGGGGLLVTGKKPIKDIFTLILFLLSLKENYLKKYIKIFYLVINIAFKVYYLSK